MASNRSRSSALSTTEIELVNRVHSRFPQNEPDKFRFFYTIASPFSNFYPCTVREDDNEFHCTEQYMMYHKAKLFDDNEIARQILDAKTPAKCKALGRKVKNFDEQIWIDNRTRIVTDGNYLKFTQDEQLKQTLLDQQGVLLVESSISDRIWGVGLRDTDPLINTRSNWKGLNLMGYLLTDLAYRILTEEENK